MIQFPRTAHSEAILATPEEIAKEEMVDIYLASDLGLILMTDSGEDLSPNVPDFGYTHHNLHRRIDQDPEIPPGSDYPFVKYDKDGNAFKQTVVIGVWDGVNSYRTTTTYTHDEESETCEIP